MSSSYSLNDTESVNLVIGCDDARSIGHIIRFTLIHKGPIYVRDPS